MKTIEFDEECKACGGTGLYKGMAERDGFAVVCHNCKGTGKYHFIHSYNDFEGRKESKDVKRVLETNPGIVVGVNIEKKLTLESYGGMPYENWRMCEPFPEKSEMREYTCPCWWYQCANYDLKPEWEECYRSLGGSFSNCKYFGNKKACWARFDEEHAKKSKVKE